MTLPLPPERDLPRADRMIEEILDDDTQAAGRASPTRTLRFALAGIAAASVLVVGGIAVGSYLSATPQPAATPVPTISSPTPTPDHSTPRPTASPIRTTPAPVDPARLPLGTSMTSTNFRVTVSRVVADPAQGVLVEAEVCVQKLPANPTGNTTRVSWDPWQVATGEQSFAPRLADASHPPADLFPQEVFLEVSQCASGWIPFADLGERAEVRRVVYANSLGDTAAWLPNS